MEEWESGGGVRGWEGEGGVGGEGGRGGSGKAQARLADTSTRNVRRAVATQRLPRGQRQRRKGRGACNVALGAHDRAQCLKRICECVDVLAELAAQRGLATVWADEARVAAANTRGRGRGERERGGVRARWNESEVDQRVLHAGYFQPPYPTLTACCTTRRTRAPVDSLA